VEEIRNARGEALYLHQDVSLEEGWPDVVEATERRFRRLDVANAGIETLSRAIEMRLAATNRGEPRRRIPVGKIRSSSNASCRRWLY
jgi:NAD(P)-dependent dehydrogenase (short-subunit alcohol dehydrogenase family)